MNNYGSFDLARIVANLVFAVSQFIVPFLMFGGDFEANSAKGPLPLEDSFATPAPYAFAIWGVIYLGSLAYAIVQALPQNWANPLFQNTGWWIAVCFLCATLWIWFASKGPLAVTVPLILIMFICLLIVHWKMKSAGAGGALAFAPLSIYFAWLTAAIILNSVNVLPQYGFGFHSVGPDTGGLIALIAILTIAGAIFVFIQPSSFYTFTLVWALTGIFIANYSERGLTALTGLSATAAIIVLLLGLVMLAGLRPLSLR